MKSNLHEDFTSKKPVETASDRNFGFVFTIFFLLIGFLPLYKGRPVRFWAVGLSAIFVSATLLRPRLLQPLNRVWTQLGLLLGRIVNPIVMGLLFYLAVTPMAMILRLLGKDPLRLRPDPNARSYWIERRPPGPAPKTIERQF
jgi:saxitoxin biosynthesis operon SxtJ-like protein